MKKSLTLVISLLFITSSIFSVVSPARISLASTYRYLRVIDNETPFYADEHGTKLLFYLPYTYYVKLLYPGEIYSHIEYSVNGIAIDGYTLSSKLFEDNQYTAKPYLNKTITTCSTAMLYSTVTDKQPIQYIFAERDLYYFGKYEINSENYYYVSYNNRLGYVNESQVYPFVIPEHPNELTFIQPDEPSTDVDVEENVSSDDGISDSTLRFIIIGCLIVAGFIALFIALYPKKRKENCSNYYNERDGE